MAQKTMTYVVLILLLGAGFLFGSFFGGALIGGFAAPSGHKAIAEDFKIYDNYYGWLPPPTLVSSGSRKYGEQLSSLSVFKMNSSYQYSVWSFQRKGDTEMFMEIWGPDDSEHSYDVGFGRCGLYSGGYITYQGVTVLNIEFAETSVKPNGQGFSAEGDYAITIQR
jgi:hypothetical protein